MNTPLYIARRISGGRQRSFSRFVIRLAVAATTVSVAAMVLSLAFVNGFQKVISEKIFGFWGHIRIQRLEPFRVNIAEETPIIRNDSIARRIRGMEHVNHVEAFATKSAILHSGTTIEGVLVKGVEAGYPFEERGGFLRKGRWPSFADTAYSKEVVISEYTAEQLSTDVGRNLLIYFILPGEERPRTRRMTVCGIYKTGMDIYDRTFAIGDMRLIQRLNDWEQGQIGGYEVVVDDIKAMDSVSNLIYATLPAGWDSQTLRELQPDIFDWIGLQDINKYVLIAVMTLVAIINLVTCLIILVLERTRMIGILKALGMGDGGVQRIFLYYGAIITLWGISLGLASGLGIAWLQKRTGFIRLREEAYYMDRAPVEIVWWQVAGVAAGTFAVCFLTLLIPSLIGRRISPARAVGFR